MEKKLTKNDWKTILEVLRWSVEDVTRNTWVGKTTSNKIKRVLAKLKEAWHSS